MKLVERNDDQVTVQLSTDELKMICMVMLELGSGANALDDDDWAMYIGWLRDDVWALYQSLDELLQ